jgi:hypothetical protein
MITQAQSQYIIGMEIITSQPACVNWCQTRLRNRLGVQYRFKPWKKRGQATIYRCANILIPRSIALRTVRLFVKLLVQQYPRVEIILYPHVPKPGPLWRKCRNIANDYSDPRWNQRTEGRIWSRPRKPKDRQIVNKFADSEFMNPPLVLENVSAQVDVVVGPIGPSR